MNGKRRHRQWVAEEHQFLENGLIWFGAGVSLAEILTGTYFASLGFSTGLLAIIIGHIIGCGMMFFAGFYRWKDKKNVQWKR